MTMNIDWQSLFTPTTPVLELVLRGSMMYLLLFAALRMLVRRHVGSMSLMDLLLMVLIADAAQNAMAGQYESITEGIIVCGTLIFWNYFLDWLSYKLPAVERLLEPPPLPIVRDGVMLRRNMRQELITQDELMSLLREQGVFDLQEIKLASVEPDGGVSVQRRNGGGAPDAEADANRRRRQGPM
jgi:uncharacterized membrane protein YcaP (DUF421 family)